MAEGNIRDRICAIGRSLFERGLTPGSSGNISVRLPSGGLLCTPTNVSLGSLDPARLSELDARGQLILGDPPTKEVPLHLALYESRGGSQAIVHLHSTHSVAVSMLPDVDPADVFPPSTPYYLMRIGRTALLPYFRPGDPLVGDAIRGLAGQYSAVLLANHGPVVAGNTLEAAAWATEELEHTAKLHLLLQGRHPQLLTRAEAAALRGDTGSSEFRSAK